MLGSVEDQNLEKGELRRCAYDVRAAQTDKQALSGKICKAFTELPEYQAAGTVMWYLDCRSEVRTREYVASLIASDKDGSGKRMVIPYCTVDADDSPVLGLWSLESMDELVAGTWNILEPPKQRWGESGKEVSVKTLDLIMVPGVAFDRMGGRLGNGQGYYDKLLNQVRADTTLIGAGFECQLFDKIPMRAHDIYLDGILTEQSLYRCAGRTN